MNDKTRGKLEKLLAMAAHPNTPDNEALTAVRMVGKLTGNAPFGALFSSSPESGAITASLRACNACLERKLEWHEKEIDALKRTRATLEKANDALRRENGKLQREIDNLQRQQAVAPPPKEPAKRNLTPANAARRHRAAQHAATVWPVIRQLREKDPLITLSGIAEALNQSAIRSPGGGPWTPMAVSRIEQAILGQRWTTEPGTAKQPNMSATAP